jgi:hypothetical protein
MASNSAGPTVPGPDDEHHDRLERRAFRWFRLATALRRRRLPCGGAGTESVSVAKASDMSSLIANLHPAA